MTDKEYEGKLPNGRMDYDNLFKTVIRRYFWEALEIFSPTLCADADTEREPEFLEQELEKVVYDLEHGPNRTDLLVRVPLRNGGEQWILCHLELQGEGGGDLPTRMNRYRAMIYLKYDVEPVAIAVLTSPRPAGERRLYASERYETRIVYEYKNVDVRELNDETLTSGDNRIALVLYAAKRALDSRSDERRKFRYLRDISDIWAERGWSNEDKRIIMLSIEYLINLKDPDYSRQMVEHFEELEKEGKVVYTTLAERVYTEKGIERGLEQGIEQGKLAVAANLLKKGFSLDEVVEITDLPRSEIEAALR